MSRPRPDAAALGRARDQVATTCRELAARGLVPGTSGNVSVAIGSLIAVTATGLVLAEATLDQITVVTGQGEGVLGESEPTSELLLHLALHQQAAAAGLTASAVVHTHAPASTAVSCLVDEVPAVHYATLQLGGPVRVAPFAPFGTRQLAELVQQAMIDRQGALLANHGAVTVAPGLEAAVQLAEVLEWLCEVYLRAAAVGPPRTLSPAQLAAVQAELDRRDYGNLRSRVTDGPVAPTPAGPG